MCRQMRAGTSSTSTQTFGMWTRHFRPRPPFSCHLPSESRRMLRHPWLQLPPVLCQTARSEVLPHQSNSSIGSRKEQNSSCRQRPGSEQRPQRRRQSGPRSDAAVAKQLVGLRRQQSIRHQAPDSLRSASSRQACRQGMRLPPGHSTKCVRVFNTHGCILTQDSFCLVAYVNAESVATTLELTRKPQLLNVKMG
jgi:hypothetical protein